LLGIKIDALHLDFILRDLEDYSTFLRDLATTSLRKQPLIVCVTKDDLLSKEKERDQAHAHPARCPRDEVGDLGNHSQVKDTPGQAQKSSEL